MTVEQLIDVLEQLPKDLVVVDTYGNSIDDVYVDEIYNTQIVKIE